MTVNRKILFYLLPVALLAGCAKTDEKAADETKAPREFSVQSDTNGNPVVTFSADTQKRIALQVAEIASAELPAQVTAFGSVLDPAPLLALQGEITLDEAAWSAAEKSAQRARALFADDQNVSRKSVEATETDEQTAKIKLDTARQSLRLDWGERIAGLNDKDRAELIDGLATGHTALARVEVSAAESLSNLPPSARLSCAGQDHWTDAQPLSFAARVDPKTLGQGIILQVSQPDASLAPGAAVKAALPIPGEPLRGVLLPEPAILQYDGRAWVYTQNGATNFVRREVTLETRLGDGWFTTNGPAIGEKIVTVGAPILLSEEQKSQSPAAAD
ncbi:MAG TPA: hypothetical protein VHB20_01205 [Verrucomicrobiae bacterium]|jgi:hypothetical protein|nr:hypothetical protein [Verrucomicrobiae bacterium]